MNVTVALFLSELLMLSLLPSTLADRSFVYALGSVVYLCLKFQDVFLQPWASLNPEMQIGSVEQAECS